MKQKFSDYTTAAFILIATAVIILVIVFFTNRNDLTSATLLLGGIGCFVGGIVLLAFDREPSLDPQIVSQLSVQGILNTCQLCTDLAVHGDAHFIPTENGVMQFIPAGSEFRPPNIKGRYSFYLEENGCGILLTPSGDPLLTYLKKEHHLTIPHDEESIFELIKETIEDVLELATRVEMKSSTESITANLVDYRLFSGCVAIQTISPKCCTMSPCPTCSLIGCVLAQGLAQYFAIESIQLDEKENSLQIIFSSKGRK